MSPPTHTQIDGDKQRAPDWEDPEFWLTNISEKSAVELKVALSLKGEKRLDKSLPTKGGSSKAKSRKIRQISEEKVEKAQGNGNMYRSTTWNWPMSNSEECSRGRSHPPQF